MKLGPATIKEAKTMILEGHALSMTAKNPDRETTETLCEEKQKG